MSHVPTKGHRFIIIMFYSAGPVSNKISRAQNSGQAHEDDMRDHDLRDICSNLKFQNLFLVIYSAFLEMIFYEVQSFDFNRF